MEESLDKKKELMQWMLHWESNLGDIQAAQSILEEFKNYAPAIDFISEISEVFQKRELIPVSLLYELYVFHAERNDQAILQQFKSRWKRVKVETEQDYFSYLHYLRDVQDLDQAIRILDEARQKGFNSDRFFLIHLELLIDRKDFDQALKLLTVQRCKDMGDPECYLIRAKLLSHSSPRTSSLRDEVEYLCLEALRLDAEKMDAFMLLLEWYAMVFRSAGKIMFLFKFAQSYNIQDLMFYREVLSALLIINETEEASPVYEALQKLLPVPEQAVLDFVKLLHIDLNCPGYARKVWRSYRQRGAIDNEFFYQDIIKMCQVLRQVQSACSSLKGERMEDEWDQALQHSNDEIVQMMDQTMLFCYDQLIRINPENSSYYYHKACMFKENKPQNAVMLFQKALDIEPQNLQIKLELAKTYELNGLHLKAYESCLELAENSDLEAEVAIEACLHLSRIALKFSWPEQAEHYLKKAQGMVHQDVRSRLALSRLYFEEYCLSGSVLAMEKSQRQAKRILIREKNNQEALLLLSSMAFEQKKYLSCIKYGLDALKNSLPPMDAVLFLRISRSYFELFLDKPLSSKEYLKEALHYAEKIKAEDSLQGLIHCFVNELHLHDGEEQKTKLSVSENGERKKHKKTSKTEIIPMKVGTLQVLSISGCKSLFSEAKISEIQSSLVEGPEKLHISGNVDDLWHETAHFAYGVTRQLLPKIKLGEAISNKEVLLDAPDGHSRKRTHSGVVNLAVSMISAFLDQPLPQDFLIFGEMSLSGKISPVHGLEKLIKIAYEKKISKIFLSTGNQLDYADMIFRESDLSRLPEVRFVSSLNELLVELFEVDVK